MEYEKNLWKTAFKSLVKWSSPLLKGWREKFMMDFKTEYLKMHLRRISYSWSQNESTDDNLVLIEKELDYNWLEVKKSGPSELRVHYWNWKPMKGK